MLLTSKILTCLQDSFESKTSNPTAEMGSMSYIIPLRSESDEDFEPEPQPHSEPTIAFKNKVAPTSSSTMLQDKPTAKESVQSRSPLFRAKSREFDQSLSGTETATTIPITTDATIIRSTEIRSDSGTAKKKRSMFSNKSNSAGTNGSAGRPVKPNRSISAKLSKKSKL